MQKGKWNEVKQHIEYFLRNFFSFMLQVAIMQSGNMAYENLFCELQSQIICKKFQK